MAERLTIDEVRHVAKLARLRLTDQQLQRYRDQLSTVLGHIAKISELDVENVEPLTHPSALNTRLDQDKVGESLPVETVLELAPSTELDFLSVPKVLDDQEDA